MDHLVFPLNGCGVYIIPSPVIGNFYTGPGGTGTQLAGGSSINSNQTIYYYAVINSVVCRDEAFNITVFPLPAVDTLQNVTTCNSYALPTIVNGGFYTLPGGQGTNLFSGNPINTTQTIYVYSNDGRCSNETSFVVTIIDTSIYSTVISCGSFTLPAISLGNYYTQPMGAGTIIPAGTSITSSQVVYYYAPITTTPNCTDLSNYNITILPLPTVDAPANRLECESYVLPTLTNGNYFSSSGGVGPLNAGDVISSSQTLFVYGVSNLGCTLENSFTITIRQKPIVDIFTDVFACSDFTLPPLTNGNYYTAPSGGGILLQANSIITSSQTLYVYAVSGTLSNCTAENSFIIIINPLITPQFSPIGIICQGLPAPALPTASTDLTPINGTWNPSTISTATVGTSTYTFTPLAGQCAVVTTLSVTIDAPSIVPTFNPIGIICQGLAAPALPTASTNTTPINGTWNPSTISTATVGTSTYTFTPLDGQCATVTTLNVTIASPSTVPTFNQIAPICQNGAVPNLPTSSTNTTAILGAWNPSSVNTLVAGTTVYTFTPNAGQCAVSSTMSITITAPTVATFNQIAAICQGGNAPALSSSSTNNISGTWNPATINTANAGTTTYTFTPDAGLCATGTTMQITIYPTPLVNPINSVYACDSYTLPSLSVGNYFAQPNGISPITNLTLITSQLVYVYAQSGTTPNCTDQESFQVNVTPSPQFTITGECDGANFTLQVVPIVPANFSLETATYNWSGPSVTNNGEPTLQITETGVYTCIVSIPNSSCSTTQTYNATDIGCEIPKGISPNSDGLNDTFDLTGFNVAKLSIFNRYGTSVYSKTNYTNEWGGQSNSGNELSDGTYYYVIELKNGRDTKTGWVYINREIK